MKRVTPVIAKTSSSRTNRLRAKRRTKADRAAVASLVELLKRGADVRQRKARRTRAAIKVRSYENDLKLEVAIERLIDDLYLMPLAPDDLSVASLI
ncbi:MAG TPA: hypothetical protein VGN72_10520 [Tepidisphaeraceae bacterium]|jgi:hypothetical protein|nr:hypothetical protein [Tepidisphaeraceae bacterium]